MNAIPYWRTRVGAKSEHDIAAASAARDFMRVRTRDIIDVSRPAVLDTDPMNFAATARHLAVRFGQSWADVSGTCRKPGLVIARQTIAWVGVSRCRKSLPYVAQIMNRDHSTILHSRRRVDAMIDEIGLSPLADDPVEAGFVVWREATRRRGVMGGGRHAADGE